MTDLKLARGFTLPLDLVTRKTAILAKSGAGKSNTAKVIVEGVLDAGAQVVIDPVGHWWGLRSLFPVPVLGGMNGDIPLDPLAGKLIADVAAESGQSLILDVSLMDSDDEMQRFAYEFAERFYKQKQLHPTAVLIVLEEADEFAPQDTRGTNVPRMVGAWARIAKRGRGRGIGLLSITLRSAALSKNVLNQSDGIVAMRTTAPLDIKAVEEWVKATRAIGADEVIPSLPSLETGEAWIWIPEYGVLKRVKLAKARSLDTSATPEVGAKPTETKKLKPIDLAALGERMQATVERAKENDPAELKKRVRDLERQLRERPVEQSEPERVEVQVPVEVPVLDDESIETLQGIVAEIRDVAQALGPLRAVADQIETAIRGASARSAPVRTPPRPAALPQPSLIALETQEKGIGGGGRTVPADSNVTGPQQKILDALGWYEALGVVAPTRVQVGLIAGYSHSSGNFANLLGKLSTAGLVDYPTPGLVALTDTGRALATDPGLPGDDEGVQAEVMRRLPAPQARLLAVLIERWPDAISREDLGEVTGYSHTSGNFANLLGKLKTAALISYPDKGHARAEDVLFPMAVR